MKKIVHGVAGHPCEKLEFPAIRNMMTGWRTIPIDYTPPRSEVPF
jgi:hypothetical protein